MFSCQIKLVASILELQSVFFFHDIETLALYWQSIVQQLDFLFPDSEK